MSVYNRSKIAGTLYEDLRVLKSLLTASFSMVSVDSNRFGSSSF